MKNEFEKVLEKSYECLDDANFLFEDKRYEAAVNRAYYSMFNAVLGLLINKEIYVKTHSGIKLKFHEHFLKTKLLPIELGKIYENAFDLRQEADYDYAADVPSEAAQQTIDDAATFVNAIKSFLEKS